MKYRYERKYLVSNTDLFALRRRIIPFLEPDVYSLNGMQVNEYTVRSIYFDTPHFDALYEKVEGFRDRSKLRIRGYNDLTGNSEVFLEVKKKVGNRIIKSRHKIPFTNLCSLLQGNMRTLLNGKEPHAEAAASFLYHLKKDGYKAVNLVAYEREPFFGKFDRNVRITLDKNIRTRLFANIDELFSESGLQPVWKGHFILEVKYLDDEMPTWIRSIIQEFELTHQALSKYAEAFYSKEVSVYNYKLMERRC
jgi:hypothetical protein